MSGKVVALFVSPSKGVVDRKDEVEVRPGGFVQDKNFAPPEEGKEVNKRQVLITEIELLKKHSMEPGSQKENITVEGVDLNSQKPGAVFEIGGVTFQLHDKLCCKGEKESIKGERGVFASVVEGSKTIKVGDSVAVKQQQ
eukprot:TRINITY_DN637_c0_g1_i1.p1 TRINITY_DN637_c0_g1~~TRINITY_DN637_c0_g1_i1.p1  ORF type:complete len:140 (-),score=43.73 TRINITY_DN637_c0_g1_i1:46-465(-)